MGDNANTNETVNSQAQQNQTAEQTESTSQEFDYDKLAEIVTGRLSATEDSVLKGYFKQQGLTREEADAAIKSYKEQKQANTPDAGALQSQLNAAQTQLVTQRIEHEATMQAVALGIDAKTIPYLLRMTDLSGVKIEDGKINTESIANALAQTLADVPGLKPQPAEKQGIQFGASQNNETVQAEDLTRKRFGLK